MSFSAIRAELPADLPAHLVPRRRRRQAQTAHPARSRERCAPEIRPHTLEDDGKHPPRGCLHCAAAADPCLGILRACRTARSLICGPLPMQPHGTYSASCVSDLMRSCLGPSRYDGGAHALAGREEAAPPSALAYAACASSRDLSVHGALPPIAHPSPPRRTAETANVALARGRHSPTPRCALSTRPSAVHAPQDVCIRVPASVRVPCASRRNEANLDDFAGNTRTRHRPSALPPRRDTPVHSDQGAHPLVRSSAARGETHAEAARARGMPRTCAPPSGVSTRSGQVECLPGTRARYPRVAGTRNVRGGLPSQPPALIPCTDTPMDIYTRIVTRSDECRHVSCPQSFRI